MTAPFTGTVADVLGRKRVIVAAMFLLVVPTLMVGLAQSLSALIFWRAVQGLVLPPIFAVTVAYIGDEWPTHEATTAAGIYSSGSSFGGFSGRLVTGFLADLIGWRAGFMALAAIALAGAIAVAFLLPPERKFVRSEGLLASGRQMLAHFRNRQLIATYAVGFGVLFNFICTFTYISFHLAAAPYNLSAGWLGAIFVVYLVGSALTPWTGWAVGRFGRRRFMVRVIALWIAGIALTLSPSLPLIILGLAIGAGCGLMCQAISTGLRDHHRQGRPLLGGRALCHQFLCRRQLRRGARRRRLYRRRLAGLRRHGGGDAGCHGGDRILRLGDARAAGADHAADRAAVIRNAKGGNSK